MRPFQIEPDGEWVDLDTIQSMTPPRLVGRNGAPVEVTCHYGDPLPWVNDSWVTARFEWRHAFQNEPRFMQRPVDVQYHLTDPTPEKRYTIQVRGYQLRESTPHELVELRAVFERFLQAWQSRGWSEQPDAMMFGPIIPHPDGGVIR